MSEFVLTGFRQDENIRWYGFQGVSLEKKRIQCTVGADLVLVRKYRIPLQDLPLLCRHVLEGSSPVEVQSALMFTEEDMIGYASRRVAEQEAADQKRKANRPPVPTTGGWRAG